MQMGKYDMLVTGVSVVQIIPVSIMDPDYLALLAFQWIILFII